MSRTLDVSCSEYVRSLVIRAVVLAVAPLGVNSLEWCSHVGKVGMAMVVGGVGVCWE